MQTITLPVSYLEEIEQSLKKALSRVRELKGDKNLKVEKPPKFWTEKQWEQAEKEADRDIAAGRVRSFDSIEELIEDLHKT